MRLFSYVCSILFLVSITFFAQQQYINERTIEKNTESTVFISMENPDGVVMMGSGVIVDDHYILSANHVVVAQAPVPSTKFFVTFLDGKKEEIEPGPHFADADIGVFLFSNKEKIRPARLLCKTPESGTPIYTIGNPRGYQWLVTRGTIASNRPLSNGAFKIKSNFSIHGVTLNMAIYPGNSGGGIYDDKTNALISIVSSVLQQPLDVFSEKGKVDLQTLSMMNIGLGVNSETVCGFLTKNNISFETI